ANRILDEGDVQHALTQVVVRQLSDAAGADLQLAEPFLASVVQQVVEADAFRTVFDGAVSRAHHVLVTRGSTDFVLDLKQAYGRIKGTLEQVAPKLASQLPSERKLDILVLTHNQLSAVYDTIDQVKRIVEVLTIVGVVSVASGIALSPRRWRALALAGFVLLGTAVLFLLALVVGRAVLHSRIGDPVYADAARSVFGVLTRGLVVQTVVIGAVAVMVAVAARFTDRHGLPAWPRATRGAWRWIVHAVPVPVLDVDHDGTVSDAEAAPGAVLARLRLPEPRRQVRRQHVARALALLAVGLVALFDTDFVTTVAVVLFGVAALYFAVVEGLAAWRGPRHPGTEPLPGSRL
ncbi:MAG TPA: hypothetical protein VFC99_13870, partial [Acidimicrobiia bacterium]|nr:hypothetical protein [Acidimicrobiia bacterium]